MSEHRRESKKCGRFSPNSCSTVAARLQHGLLSRYFSNQQVYTPTMILIFVGPEHPLPYEGGGGVSQSTPPPGGRILPEVHAEPAAAGRLPGRLLPEAVAPEALAADVYKHRGEQGGGDLG